MLPATAPKIDVQRTGSVSFFLFHRPQIHYSSVSSNKQHNGILENSFLKSFGSQTFDVMPKWRRRHSTHTLLITLKTLADADYCVGCRCVCVWRANKTSIFLPIHLPHIILVIKWNDFVSRKNIPVSIIVQKVCQRKVAWNEHDIIGKCFHLMISKTFRMPVNAQHSNVLCASSILFEFVELSNDIKAIVGDPFDGS